MYFHLPQRFRVAGLDQSWQQKKKQQNRNDTKNMARNVNLNSVYSFACCYFFWRILASQKVVTAREEHEAQLPLNVNFRFPPLFFCFAFLFPWVTISWGNPAQLSSARKVAGLTIFACQSKIVWKSIGSHVWPKPLDLGLGPRPKQSTADGPN